MKRKLEVMLVHDEPAQLSILQEALQAEGHAVVAECRVDSELSLQVRASRPDIVLVQVDTPNADLFKALHRIHQEHPRPVVLFAARSDRATTRRAFEAGVSAYIVDGLQPHRIGSLIELARARFEMQNALRKDLQELRGRLADERDIERAKGVIMKRQRVDEGEATEMLDKLARSRKQSVGDFSRTVLEVAAAM